MAINVKGFSKGIGITALLQFLTQRVGNWKRLPRLTYDEPVHLHAAHCAPVERAGLGGAQVHAFVELDGVEAQIFVGQDGAEVQTFVGQDAQLEDAVFQNGFPYELLVTSLSVKA